MLRWFDRSTEIWPLFKGKGGIHAEETLEKVAEEADFLNAVVIDLGDLLDTFRHVDFS